MDPLPGQVISLALNEDASQLVIILDNHSAIITENPFRSKCFVSYDGILFETSNLSRIHFEEGGGCVPTHGTPV